MDLQKTKIYLDKLNREFARMDKDPDNIMRIDMDIMASYVRELYDAILSPDPGHAAKHESTLRKPSLPRQPEPPAEVGCSLFRLVDYTLHLSVELKAEERDTKDQQGELEHGWGLRVNNQFPDQNVF